MRITYDAVADAAYIYLADKIQPPETRQVDEDIYLDFDEHGKLVGIEVLDASQRLQLSYLMPLVERIDVEWVNLKSELQRKKEAGQPIKIDKQKANNWVHYVGEDHVILREADGVLKKVTARQLLGSPRSGQPVIETLRTIGGYGEE